jgi:hypothetical protein
MANTFAVDALDPGQIKMIEASQTLENYAFKIELNDSGGGTGAKNSERLFYGLVMQSQEAGGGANTVQTLNGTVEINSNIVTVAAVPGTLMVKRVGGHEGEGGQAAGVQNLSEGEVEETDTEGETATVTETAAEARARRAAAARK